MTAPDRDLSAEAGAVRRLVRSAEREGGSPEGEGGSAKVDRLDAAIDLVAARMVTMPDDGQLTLRIVSALPQRTWRWRWAMPQLAVIGAVVCAAFVWTTRSHDTPATTLLPAVANASVAALPAAVIANDSGVLLNTGNSAMAPVAPMAPVALTGEADHERSLPAIDALTALAVDAVSPSVIPASPLLELAPIEIVDLPMTADFPPRR